MIVLSVIVPVTWAARRWAASLAKVRGLRPLLAASAANEGAGRTDRMPSS